MPNIAKVLKEEIARIAKKEAKAAVTPIRKPSIRIRKDTADLKARVTTMEKEIKRLTVLVVNLASTQPIAAEAAPEGKSWIFGKGIKTLRRKLGLTQGELATLVGVSTGAVVQWEAKAGKLNLRTATKKAILAIRGIGKAEARKRLEAMKPVKKAKATVKRKK